MLHPIYLVARSRQQSCYRLAVDPAIRNDPQTLAWFRRPRAISNFASGCTLSFIQLVSSTKLKVQCLWRKLQCLIIESDCEAWQSLRLTFHCSQLPNDKSSEITNDTRHPVPFGTTSHGSGSLVELSENLIEGQCGLLLQYRLTGPIRKTSTLRS